MGAAAAVPPPPASGSGALSSRKPPTSSTGRVSVMAASGRAGNTSIASSTCSVRSAVQVSVCASLAGRRSLHTHPLSRTLTARPCRSPRSGFPPSWRCRPRRVFDVPRVLLSFTPCVSRVCRHQPEVPSHFETCKRSYDLPSSGTAAEPYALSGCTFAAALSVLHGRGCVSGGPAVPQCWCCVTARLCVVFVS